MKEKTTILTVREDAGVIRKLDNLARLRFGKRSDIVREALQAYLKKEAELKDIKKVIAKKFAKGEISFDEVVQLLGYEEARKIAFYKELAEKSLARGLKE